jgi:hypothetical protein
VLICIENHGEVDEMSGVYIPSSSSLNDARWTPTSRSKDLWEDLNNDIYLLSSGTSVRAFGPLDAPLDALDTFGDAFRPF